VAVATVDIQVNSQGAVSALRQTTAASRQLESAIGNQTKQIQTAANGMRYFIDATGRARAENGRFLSSTQKAAAGLNKQTAAANGLGGAVGKLLGSFALISAAKFVFAKTAELETQTRSLQVLTGSAQQAKSIIQELQQLGAVTPFTSTELIDTAKRLNAFGVEGDKVVETTRRLADVAGATGAELQGLATAYGQVQAKGRLQGEELLQFQERGVALQDELRKMYGLTGEEFQKALSKGRISAEAVEVAVKRLTDTGGKYANGAIAQSDTLQGRFSTLMDGVESLARGIGTVLAPTIKNVLNLAIMGIDAINTLMASGRSAAFSKNLLAAQTKLGAGALGVDPALKDTQNLINQLQGSKQKNLQGAKADLQTIADIRKTLQSVRQREMTFNLSKIGRETIGRQFQQLRSLETAANAAVRAAQAKQQPTGSNAIPALLGETGGGKNKSDKSAETAAKRAAAEALRLKNSLGTLGTELSLKQQIAGIDEKIFQAGLAKDSTTAIRLEGEKKLAQINADILKLENQKLTPQEKQAKMQLLIQDRTNAQKDTQQQLILNQVQAAQQAEAAIRPIIQEGELLKAKLAGTELQYQKELLIRQILKDNPGLRRDEVAAIVTENEALQRQLTQAEQLKQVYLDVGMTIKSGVVDAIQGAIDGTKSLGEVATGILKNIANKVLDVAINFALFGALSGTGTGGGLLGGLIPRARGGSVSAGTSYMVGERGPELFTPKHGGSIVPNNALGGGSTSVVVNVDASGSSVQGDQAQAKQLGVVVSAAVQAELVKQQRPGGLLAGTRR